jgi:hypothetical protein
MSPFGRKARLHGLTSPVATADTRIFCTAEVKVAGSGGRVGELRDAGICAPATLPSATKTASAVVNQVRSDGRPLRKFVTSVLPTCTTIYPPSRMASEDRPLRNRRSTLRNGERHHRIS